MSEREKTEFYFKEVLIISILVLLFSMILIGILYR